LSEKLYIAMQEKYQSFKVSDQAPQTPGSVIRAATRATNVSRAKNRFNIVAATLFGLLFGVICALVREYLTDTVESPEELQDALAIPVLARIPFDDSFRKTSILCAEKPNTPVAESFRALRSRLRIILDEKQISSFLVTSTMVKEGKSSVALNLAVTFAQFGKKTILVDGDLRRPTVHNKFKVENKGITNIFIDGVDVFSLVVDTKVPNLSILPSGPLVLTEDTPVISSEIFESDVIKSMIDMLRISYDVVIIDTPPIMAVADVLVISPLVEGIIFVVKSGETPKREVVMAKSTLDTSTTELLGGVLNGVRLSRGYYKYLYYYYGDEVNGKKTRRKRK
ncbi:MAG: polysaccharide biosynthesis tyrosine autokinase, partial [Victivallales bacterium]|nr:polysaccharide biosynthesis tyrosine autokinase [Victivallales bacterium]